MSELQFKGYAVHDTSKWTEFKLIEFQPKTFEADDVDIKVECCGVCGSDVHTITGGWGQPVLPVIVGHEIVGTVAQVGSNVTEFKIGQRVGVGAQICSCGTCSLCTSDHENFCANGPVYTYNSLYPNGDKAYGGYSTAIRANQRFVFPIPDALSSEQAAPMLCGGLTVFSPLLRHGVGPGQKVAIVGMGGLGHYAVQFAKALGAEVTVFSHSARKEADAKAMGADNFVVTGEGPGFAEPFKNTLNLILVTANVSEGVLLNELLSTLTFQGRLVVVASPNDPLPPVIAYNLLAKAASITGSSIGSKKDVTQMLNLAVEKGVKSWIQVKNMSEAGDAAKDVHEGNVRYRFVLKNDIPL
ncbi:GroES-like protein [Flagelloscypha sp. PMI_526]|nr:GroES-like protein [Flagelloscypha sp. PMI_526]